MKRNQSLAPEPYSRIDTEVAVADLTRTQPVVTVTMNARNTEQFIAPAIEGVLSQKTDFPIELVISDNCSKDSTLSVCRDYQNRYPDVVKVFPASVDLGLGGNFVRTWGYCRGKYVANCDSDDVWTDTAKLQLQIDFLENNPDFGLSYSDITFIDVDGNEMNQEEVLTSRPTITSHMSRYAEGDVFFELLGGNFINSSTSVFRRSVFQTFEPLVHDILIDWPQWLLIAIRSKVHFLDRKTTAYRLREGSQSADVAANPEILRQLLPLMHEVLLDFHENYRGPMGKDDRKTVFRKMLQQLRWEPGLKKRAEIAKILPAYFPGIRETAKILASKTR